MVDNKNKGPSDFNDLHVLCGLDAVKQQVNAAVQVSATVINTECPAANESPAPTVVGGSEILASVQIKSSAITLDQVKERFALIVPTTHVWNINDKQRLKKPEFMALVGAKTGKEWWDAADKRQVREVDVNLKLAAGQTEGEGELAMALGRYVYLNPSQSVWDHRNREVVNIADLKYAIPNAFSGWNQSPMRRQIDKANLVFDPTQKCDPKTHINMFHGLPLEPVANDEGCRAIIDMMWLLCNQDMQVWSWLSKWMAYPLQHVGAKMHTAVLMHSDVQGSGKSLFFDGVMRPIYGEYGATLGQTQMESQYTDWSSNLLYGLFEEIFSRDQKYSHMGTIKQMITGEKQRIEKKFMSGWEEANHMNCIFLSNELLPFPIEQSDRRFLVIWPNWKLDNELQAQVGAELKNGGAAAFLNWLLNVDTSDFEERTKPPMTEAKEWLIDFGRPTWDSFFMQWQRGQLEVPYCSCLTSDLWEVYRYWCKANGIGKVMDNQKFPKLIERRVFARQSKQNYISGKLQKQGTVYLTEAVPGLDDEGRKVIKKAWLGGMISAFRAAMHSYIDEPA
ncbi:MAG: DUF5906 domain-containing protein [Bermanella sp.]